jgi:hypothetical protein
MNKVGYTANISTTMPKLNPHSHQLIRFSEKLLRDNIQYNRLKKELLKEFEEFLNQDRRHLIKILKLKMTKAALEYGPPFYTLKKLDEEELQERIDQLGWRLVRMFLQKFYYERQSPIPH